MDSFKANRTGDAPRFYPAKFLPNDWYNLLNEKSDFPGWMKITSSSKKEQSNFEKTFSSLSVQAEASYNTLFTKVSASGGHTSSATNEKMVESGSEVSIEFEIARVRVLRPGIDSLLALSP